MRAMQDMQKRRIRAARQIGAKSMCSKPRLRQTAVVLWLF